MVLGPDIWEVLALVFLGLALGAGVELGIMLGPGRFYIAKRARKENLDSINAGEWDVAITRIIQPIKDDVDSLKDLVKAEEIQKQVGTVQARLEELDQALETRLEGIQLEPIEARITALDEAMGKHLQAIWDGLQDLPGRVRSSVAGSQGQEVKAIQKAGEAAELDAIEYYEAELSPEERLAARIDQMSPSPEWQKQHQVGNIIVQGVKELVTEKLLERRNTVTMRPVRGGKKFPEVYG